MTNIQNFIISPSWRGRDVIKKDYGDVMSRKYDKKEIPITTPIVQPTGNLSFIKSKYLYEEIIKYLDKTFPTNKSILSEKLRFRNGVMRGSNPYIAVCVDMFLKERHYPHRIATQRDLETNLQMFRDYYVDTGLALRSIAEPNKSQAENLYAQIKKANTNINDPIFIELRNLELDANLNFILTPESRYKTAECLNWKNGEKYSKTDDFGLPKEIDNLKVIPSRAQASKNSTRQISTASSGLLRSHLDGFYSMMNSAFNSNCSSLALSEDSGRVVLAELTQN